MSRIDRTLWLPRKRLGCCPGGSVGCGRIAEQGEQFGEPACIGDEAPKWTRCPRSQSSRVAASLGRSVGTRSRSTYP